MANIEEEMGKIKWEVRIGKGRVYSLQYADIMVLMAEGENEIRSMMERLEGYLDRKGLEVNTEKIKVMRFRRVGGRVSKREWRWKG